MGDANPRVVANAVAALTEIGDGDASTSASTSPGGGLDLAPAARAKLLRALNECTEWGQVFILDSLAQFSPAAAEAEGIVERVTPRLVQLPERRNSAVQVLCQILQRNFGGE